MDPKIIIEEFDSYKVFLYDDKAHNPDIDESIIIPYSGGKVFFLFYSNGKHVNRTIGNAGSMQHFVYIPTAKYPRYIDLLRYEKPLYISITPDTSCAYITTEFEPVGEGPTDMS